MKRRVLIPLCVVGLALAGLWASRPGVSIDSPPPLRPDPEASMSDRPPILFVHGMFMTPSSWSEWEPYFQDLGYETHAPSWPYREGDPATLRDAPPADLPTLGLEEVLDLYRREIEQLSEPPVLVGHSMGGLVTQILLQEGRARAGVAIDSVPPAGVRSFEWSFLRSNVPVILKLRTPFVPSKSWFRHAFAHTLDEGALETAWSEHAVPESGQVARDSASDLALVDGSADRPPLLLVHGELDRIIPLSLAKKNFDLYDGPPTDLQVFPGRTHWICGQDGWEEVAGHVAGWLDRTLDPPTAASRD